ncbi:hypothetical protein LTR78_000219 [Recurvomyces mirabilis]|uniref:Uncharacterized protein n=1 Tax=Recurvomyces mirabilis TaxID=574656 RepID=A0AAE0WXK9_9PEZI|nr:hypothetical protein LTR78_000219 [Recurvomyces mirabilis]KAK5161875.1 hypothetical protein LTS14_000220 [Recurvomyces mirabilis]
MSSKSIPQVVVKDDAFRDPSNTDFRPTHSIPKGGLFSIYREIEIAAPVQSVCDVLLDVRKWKDWTAFYGDVTITSHPHSHQRDLTMVPGTNMDFNIQMKPGSGEEKNKLHVTCSHVGRVRTLEDHDPPALTHIRWTYHNAGHMQPAFVLKAERENEMEDLGGGRTMYRTWQSFGGLAAKSYRKKYEASLKERFAEWCADLKGRVEEVHGAAHNTSGKDGGIPEVVVEAAESR